MRRNMGEGISSNLKKSNYNTGRIAANFPQVDRKLDILDADNTYHLEFKATNWQHSVALNIYFRPDNCCDCDSGAQTQARDAVIIVDSFGPQSIYSPMSDGINYPAIVNTTILNTGTTYHWVTLPFLWSPIAQPYESFNGYTRAPDGAGVVVPVDGVYNFEFQNQAYGTPTDTSLIRASIRKLPLAPNNPVTGLSEWEDISVRNYSAANGNLNIHQWPFPPQSIFVFTLCIPLHQGDIIDGWLQATDVGDWQPGTGDIAGNKMAISLLGLGYGSLEGYVLYQATGLPVVSQNVTINGETGTLTAITNANGYYLFEDITPKPYTVNTAGSIAGPVDTIVRFDEVARVDFLVA